MENESDVMKWPLASYGCIIRGDETTGEDQVAIALNENVARRMVACWNVCSDISTFDLEQDNYIKIKPLD